MARGRLGSKAAAAGEMSDATMPCKVSAEISEDGELHLSVTATGEYLAGSRVSASFDYSDDAEQSDIPADLAQKVFEALTAVLDEAHEELKEEFQRERNHAAGIQSAANATRSDDEAAVEIGGQA